MSELKPSMEEQETIRVDILLPLRDFFNVVCYPSKVKCRIFEVADYWELGFLVDGLHTFELTLSKRHHAIPVEIKLLRLKQEGIKGLRKDKPALLNKRFRGRAVLDAIPADEHAKLFLATMADRMLYYFDYEYFNRTPGTPKKEYVDKIYDHFLRILDDIPEEWLTKSPHEI